MSDAAADPDPETDADAAAGARSRLSTVRETARSVLALAAECQVTFLSAALAYYSFVSTVPLIVLGVGVATAVGGEALADALVGLAGQALTPTGEALLRGSIVAGEGRSGVTALGLILLLWGSLKAFRAFDLAFSLVYGTDVQKSIPAALADALVVLVAVGVGSLVLAGVAAAVASGALVEGLGPIALFLALLVLFPPLYYRFPDADLRLREIVPGTLFAAFGWTVLGALFQVYAIAVAGASLYGVLGGVLLVLTWFYLGALLVLLGAVLNAVRSGRAGRTTTGNDGGDR